MLTAVCVAFSVDRLTMFLLKLPQKAAADLTATLRLFGQVIKMMAMK